MTQKFSLLLVLAFIAGTYKVQSQINCANDSTGFISLVDLQSDYQVLSGSLFQGGLYPGGSNLIPPAHKAAGMSISKSIKPLDEFGNIDWIDGKVVLAAFGASTAGEPFNHFTDDVQAADGLNPCMKLVTSTNGGKGLDIMQSPDLYPFYWEDVLARIDSAGLTPEQIQIGWFKSGSKSDVAVEMPTMANALADEYTNCLQVLLDFFPNLKMVYITGFYYGGYGDSTKEFYDVISEPGGLYNNYGAKFLIERQISGDPELKFSVPERKSPWIAWGPHEWADGERANEWDGLEWICETDYSVDGGGYHMTNAGKEKESELLMHFFKHNPTTKRWFRDNPKWNSCDPFGRLSDGRDLNYNDPDEIKEQSINLYPSPNDGNFYLRFMNAITGHADIVVVNNMGQKVYTNTIDGFKPSQGIQIEITGVPAGIYYVNVNIDGKLLSKEFIIY
ncbi:MAG: T9SS type A sorting domain-containing protein [Fimbriimonadaceae bacterium]|nr:T9SS type A sorting domain-containing protein [Chitinophagales bacterium]